MTRWLVLGYPNGEHRGLADDIRLVVEGRHLGPGKRGLEFILRTDSLRPSSRPLHDQIMQLNKFRGFKLDECGHNLTVIY